MRAICPWQVWQNRHCAKYAAIGNQHWQIVVGVIQTLIIRAMLPETKGPISGLRGARAVAMPLTYFWYWTIAPILLLVPDSEARESSTSCCMRSVRLKADCPSTMLVYVLSPTLSRNLLMTSCHTELPALSRHMSSAHSPLFLQLTLHTESRLPHVRIIAAF